MTPKCYDEDFKEQLVKILIKVTTAIEAYPVNMVYLPPLLEYG